MIPGTTKDYYSVPLSGTKSADCSSVYRNPLALDSLFDTKTDHNLKTAWDIFQHGKYPNPNADCMGKRKRLPNDKLSNFEFISYSTAETLANRLGSALKHYDCINEQPSNSPDLLPIKLVGIYIPNSVEWLITEIACNGFGFTLVPIYDTLGVESLRYILKITKLSVIISNINLALNILEIIKTSPDPSEFSFKQFILITSDPIPRELTYNELGISIKLWRDVLNAGKAHSIPFSPALPNNVHTISFTSGTSGKPKGVLISQQAFTNTVISVFLYFEKKQITNIPDSLKVYLSYLPLAHMLERCFINAVYYVSGRIGVYSGEIKALLDDAQSLKPHMFITVPRLLQRIYDRVMNNIQQKNFIIRSLFYRGLSSKLQRIKATGNCEHAFYDRFVFGKLRELLGGDVKVIFVGSASLDPNIHNCLRAFFSNSIMSGYALTETCAGAFFQDLGDPQPNNVGGPILSLEYKLKSVPELEFDATTEDNPKGQLLIRGPSLSSGYFNDPENTEQSFKDGWLHTGDIVERLENGAIMIIDRLKEVFKLSQGEYISPDKVESVISRSPFVFQSFVTGLSTESFPVAIVVPDPDYSLIWAKKNKMLEEFETLCENSTFKNEILNSIITICKEAQLKGFEIVKQIHLESIPFDISNGLLTSTSKLKRLVAKKKYLDIIEKLYEDSRTNCPVS